jgi:hypothetical protein
MMGRYEVSCCMDVSFTEAVCCVAVAVVANGRMDVCAYKKNNTQKRKHDNSKQQEQQHAHKTHEDSQVFAFNNHVECERTHDDDRSRMNE